MKTAEVGNNVTVHYRGTLSDGTEFDSSRTRAEPISFQVGSGMMISGFDSAVQGMSEGETKQVTLAPDEAYGSRNENAMQAVPMAAFGPDFEFIVGGTVQGNGPMGPFLAKIKELEEEAQQVILDMNHPLAGEELTFEIELLAVADSTTTETDTATTTTTESETTTTEEE